MTSRFPGDGQVQVLGRRLPDDHDPLALYAALSEGGARSDTLLFERSTGLALLLDRAAVRAECRERTVVLTALSEAGRNVLATVAARTADRVLNRTSDRVVLGFPESLAVDAEERLRAPSPFDALRALTTGYESLSSEEPFALACLGVVAYDHVDLFETLPPPAEDPLGFPNFVFWLAESLVVFERGAKPRAICPVFGSSEEKESERAYYSAASRLADLVARCREFETPVSQATATTGAADFSRVDLDDRAYEDVVRLMKEHIAAGEVYQIVPSRTFRAPCPDPLATFSAIRQRDPSPYLFYLSAGDYALFGASPETSVRVFIEDSRLMVEVKPIAGTRPRGRTGDEDDRLEAELRLDSKETAEHMMLVDLARNDVARISIPGSRRLARLMNVERYARVMHLVSSVTGTLRPGLDAFDAMKACLNVGTLTGAPKIRATQLLRETERTKRGPYGGAIGWISGDGTMDTGVVIRSAVVKDGIAHVRAGAGVVHDSDPRAEADETRRKASALLSVLAVTGATS